MNKAMNKSYESTTLSATATTTATTPYSDTMENNVKYMNLNFVDNSESSSQVKEVEYPKLQALSYEPAKCNKPPPSKILPSTIPINGRATDENKNEMKLKEKALVDMGFKANEIEGWENIVQPPKENLYKLLKNMIDNHIKPNVQIRIGGVTFNCHMMVLQCYSDFFMECNNEVLIQLPEEKITPGAFMMVYDWMLADEPLVQREGILELFNAASFLRIKNLINQCWLCLDDDVRFREDTAFLLYLEARHYKLENLEQLMLTRICKFFLTLVASKEYLELNAKEICTLLSSNTIGVNSEIEIFMSVVRWLSNNWEEREQDMLNVVKCVRFSLMPPWFLVTLNKATDCVDIDRIASHPEVKRMINDGISYTTTQLYYGENREEFLHFLERYQLVTPTQRQWVFDKECSYHHRLDCPNMQYITYKSFLEYLEMIQSIGKNYWQSLEMAKSEKCLQPCCVRAADARKASKDSNAAVHAQYQFVRKISHDRGVQVECGIDSPVQWQRQQLPRPVAPVISSRAQKPVKYRANKCLLETRQQVAPSIVTEAKTECTQQTQQQHIAHILLDSQNRQTGASKEAEKDGKEEKQSTVCRSYSKDVQILYRKEPNTGMTDDSEQALKITSDDSNYNSDVQQQNIEVTSILNSGMTDLRHSMHNRSLKGTKLLLFGGVDPYCQHCMQQPLRQPQRPGKHPSKHDIINNCNTNNTMDEVVSTLGDGGGVGIGDQVLLYNENIAQWQQLSRIPFGSRHHHTAVLCNDLIYIVGGTRTALGCTKNSKSVWSFNPQTLKWAIECTLPESRRDFAVIAIDDRCERCPDALAVVRGNRIGGLGTGLLVIGGEGAHGDALDSVWFYDVLRKQWIKKASLNVGRYGFAATMANSEIWIAGGIVHDGQTLSKAAAADSAVSNKDHFPADVITDTLEYYSLRCLSVDGGKAGGNLCGFCDMTTEGGGRWVKSKFRLRVPRLFGKFCRVSDAKLYLVGGIGFGNADNTLSSLDEIDCFDFALAKWQHCGNMNVARHGHDVALFNDRLVIVGGVSTIRKCTLAHVELFCTRTHKSVQDLPPLPWPLSGSSVVALD